jgi:hypothetical protein
LKKQKEERGGETCKKGLGKEESEQQGIKVSRRHRMKGVHKY